MSAPSATSVLADFNDLLAIGVPHSRAIACVLIQLCELSPDELTKLGQLMLMQAEFKSGAGEVVQ